MGHYSKPIAVHQILGIKLTVFYGCLERLTWIELTFLLYCVFRFISNRTIWTSCNRSIHIIIANHTRGRKRFDRKYIFISRSAEQLFFFIPIHDQCIQNWRQQYNYSEQLNSGNIKAHVLASRSFPLLVNIDALSRKMYL